MPYGLGLGVLRFEVETRAVGWAVFTCMMIGPTIGVLGFGIRFLNMGPIGGVQGLGVRAYYRG